MADPQSLPSPGSVAPAVPRVPTRTEKSSQFPIVWLATAAAVVILLTAGGIAWLVLRNPDGSAPTKDVHQGHATADELPEDIPRPPLPIATITTRIPPPKPVTTKPPVLEDERVV